MSLSTGKSLAYRQRAIQIESPWNDIADKLKSVGPPTGSEHDPGALSSGDLYLLQAQFLFSVAATHWPVSCCRSALYDERAIDRADCIASDAASPTLLDAPGNDPRRLEVSPSSSAAIRTNIIQIEAASTWRPALSDANQPHEWVRATNLTVTSRIDSPRNAESCDLPRPTAIW